MEAYFEAKIRLFEEVLAPGASAVVWTDDPKSDAVIARCKARGLELLTVGARGETLKLLGRETTQLGQKLTVEAAGKAHVVTLALIGAYQAANALTAAGLAIATGGDPARTLADLARVHPVRGRLERAVINAAGAPVYVDYAHTPDAIESAIEALRPHTAGRLHVVFGCGGDRDKGKRPLMGAIAVRLADDVIVTDDNPRTEDAAQIRSEILASAKGAREIGDRADAIRTAVADLKTGDVLILAGKGHETGQYIKGEIFPFSDRDQAIEAALALGGRAA